MSEHAPAYPAAGFALEQVILKVDIRLATLVGIILVHRNVQTVMALTLLIHLNA